jgi:hypothetical protein
MQTARPWGYGFSFITYAVPLSLMYWAISGTVAGAALCALALALRFGLHRAARAALDVRAKEKPWLILLRDVAGLVIWAASFFGRRVAWRDQTLLIDRQGRLSA